jgi:AcrR family transcriptional regulator
MLAAAHPHPEVASDMSNQVARPPLAPEDGRRQRSQRSRQAIVEALLELLRSGEVQPSSSAIAARAGLTQRTIFNHFADMDELMAAAAERQSERIRSLLPTPTEGDLDERTSAFADQLARLLEDTMHVRWAVMVHEVRMTGGVDIVRYVHSMLRQRVEAAFGPELAAMPARRRASTLDGIDVLADAGVWRIRRIQHGQSYDQARAVVERTLRALLHDVG